MASGDVIAFGVVCAIVVLSVTIAMVYMYARPQTPILALFTVTVSWLFTFSLCFILPMDLAPDVNRDDLQTYWEVMNWCSLALTWVLIPFQLEFYNAGDFTFKAKLIRSIRMNLVFFAVAGVAFLVFLLYLIISKRISPSNISGFIICLSNTWGLLLAVLLLGYGLVEVPKLFWHSGNRIVLLKRCQHEASQIYSDGETAKEELSALVGVVTRLNQQLSQTNSMRPYVEEIKKNTLEMNATDVDLTTLPAPTSISDTPTIVNKLRTHDPDLNLLTELHAAIKKALRHVWLYQARWQELTDRVIELETLINEARNEAAPTWGTGFFRALYWRYKVIWQPWLMRALGIVAALISTIFVWSEITAGVPINISPFGQMIHAVKHNAGAVQFLAAVPLMYLCGCAYFALFRMKISQYYHMHATKSTDEQSLLFNAGYLLRLIAPLGFNYITMLRADGTAFERVIGQMNVIPFLGTSFNNFLPIVIALFCFATLFNVFSRVLRVLHVPSFEYGEDFQDDAIAEGKMLLRKEKRKRGVKMEEPLL